MMAGTAALALSGWTLAAGAEPTPKPTVAERNRATIAGLFDLDRPLLAWEGIVIHHTAAEYASKAGIDRYHRKRFDDELGTQYHFLIHNGKKGPKGLIEAARWAHQARSIHLFKPEGAPYAITICLIGNFEERKVPKRMMESTVQLTQALSQRFAIPPERLTTHRGVDGRLTQCPGKHFSVSKWKAAVLRDQTPPQNVLPAAPTSD